MKSQKSKGGSRLLNRIWACLRQKHTSLSASYQTDASVEEENPPTTAKYHFLSFFPPLLSLHLLSLLLHVIHVSPLSPCVVSKMCRGSVCMWVHQRNPSSIKLVSIFRCSSSPPDPVYASRVYLSALTFSLSSHRHTYVRRLCRPRFTPWYKRTRCKKNCKLQLCQALSKNLLGCFSPSSWSSSSPSSLSSLPATSSSCPILCSPSVHA
jgi:hypothetical protein